MAAHVAFALAAAAVALVAVKPIVIENVQFLNIYSFLVNKPIADLLVDQLVELA